MAVVKDRLGLAFLLAGVYVVFVLMIPHESPRTYGLETDFVMTYAPSAEKFGTILGFPYEMYDPIADPFNLHGAGYGAVLWTLGQMFPSYVPGWEYFEAGKWVSVLSGGALIFLAVIWLGLLPGFIASLMLGLSPLVFELSYSCSTDMLAVALGAWAAYFAFRRKPLLAGILLGYVCTFRFEYLFFAPFFVWYLWKDKYWKFLIPLFMLVAINISIAGISSGGYDNIVLHYLNDGKAPDAFVSEMKADYPTILSVIFADPFNTLRIFVRDTITAVTRIGYLHCSPILLLGGLILLFRLPMMVGLGLAAHFFIVAFSALHWETTRYFMPEIVAVIFLGSIWLADHATRYQKRKLVIILAMLPAVFLFYTGLSEKVAEQSRPERDSGIYMELRTVVGQGDVVFSVRPQVAFMVGSNWKYWYPGAEIIDTTFWNDIDYLLYDGFAGYHRTEWRDMFSSKASVNEYFDVVYYADHIGLLVKLKE
jgi:hypothetical protein